MHQVSAKQERPKKLLYTLMPSLNVFSFYGVTVAVQEED